MTAITSIQDQLRRDEGERLVAYQDSLGYWTIGVGHCIDARKGGITTAISDYILTADLAAININLSVFLPWSSALDPVRLGVLQNMAFNLGIGGLMGFKNFLACLESGDYTGAATELERSEWATEVGPRAQRLMQQVVTGEWQ